MPPKESKEVRELKDELAVVREEALDDLGKVYDQLINRDMKSYEDNFRIVGLKYEIRDAQKEDDESKDAFINRVLNIFVKAGHLPADKVFHQEGSERGKLRAGVLRNLHPLQQRDNAAVVVAFLQSWMTSRIRLRLQGPGAGKVDGIRILAHYPPIIEAIRNEAMKERRRLLNLDNKSQRIVVQMSMKKPWVSLFRVSATNKRDRKALPFPLEDDRLENPGKTLAELARAGQEFIPFGALDDDDKANIVAGTYPAALPAPKRRKRNAMDDGEDGN